MMAMSCRLDHSRLASGGGGAGTKRRRLQHSVTVRACVAKRYAPTLVLAGSRTISVRE